MLTKLEHAVVASWRTNCRQRIQSLARSQKKAGSTIFEAWKSAELKLKPRFTSLLNPAAIGHPLRAWFSIVPKNTPKVLNVLATSWLVNTALHTNTGFVAEVFAKDMNQLVTFQAQLTPFADLRPMHVLEVVKEEGMKC